MLKKKSVKITVSDTAPLYPPLWGGPKRVWGLYGNLGDEFEVTYVGVDPGREQTYTNRRIKDNVREVIQPLCRLYYPFRRFELKVVRNLTFDIFTYLMMVFDKGFKKELNRYDADILISSHPWASPCFRIRRGQIFIYDSHNCEYLLMKQILRGRWYKWLISFFVRLVEMRACHKAKIIVVSSARDKEAFIRLYNCPEEKIFVLPNGTYIEDLPAEDKKKNLKMALKRDNRPILLFIGAYYNPNIQAARFIIEEVAPELAEADIVILGTVSDYFRDKEVPGNVRLIGRVGDKELFDWLSVADIGLNPVFTGSGINMKMLDYFSYGLPAVTTWVGARGIEGVDSRDFIACAKGEFVKNVKLLLSDGGLRERIGRNARQLAENVYDWKNISAQYSLIMSSQLNGGRKEEPVRRKVCYRCDRA